MRWSWVSQCDKNKNISNDGLIFSFSWWWKISLSGVAIKAFAFSFTRHSKKSPSFVERRDSNSETQFCLTERTSKIKCFLSFKNNIINMRDIKLLFLFHVAISWRNFCVMKIYLCWGSQPTTIIHKPVKKIREDETNILLFEKYFMHYSFNNNYLKVDELITAKKRVTDTVSNCHD